MITRSYKVKDVDMLVTASTILESAITHKEKLQKKRSNWADPFFDEFKAEIDTCIQTYLGVDSAKALRQSTIVVAGLKKEVLVLLAEFKVQVEEDFKEEKPRRDEILKQLGFTAYLRGAQLNDQEALINLLYQFKTNIKGLQVVIVSKGTAQELIDSIISHADKLKNADVTQESSKGTRKEITVEGITEFNRIYKNIMSIARISAKFFKEEDVVKDQFVFSKVAKTMNAQKFAPVKPEAKAA